MPSCLASLRGEENALGLPPARAAVVVLVDGLGAAALRARSGHARFLAPLLNRGTTMESGFPTTTASAITTLTTGRSPGQHGIVGYRALDAAHDRVVNQLSGWDAGMDPLTWQRQPTLFQLAAQTGTEVVAIGPARYRSSGFTAAALRGAAYVGANGVGERFDAVRDILNRGSSALIYLYVPELDMAAHAFGWESDAWLAELETLDRAVAGFTTRRDEGVLVTADHGVLDVPASAHILFDTVPELVGGVRHIGGDPRCLQLYLGPDATDDDRDRLADRWRAVEGERAWVATRAEACAAGWFGSVDPEVLPRIGDVLVAARRQVAYYDSRVVNDSGRTMIGQHGSFTPEEVRVPLIGLGAYRAA